MQTLYNALIRTHHITSRKKVAALKRAADTHQCAVLLRSGGCPGIMYVEGGKEPVESWVDVVRRLRYKDFQLVTRPGVEEGDGICLITSWGWSCICGVWVFCILLLEISSQFLIFDTRLVVDS